MTDETLPFPFRFPEPGEDTTAAGLCKVCLDAPIVQTPCPHEGLALAPALPPAPVERDVVKPMRQATNEPTERGGCEVCGGWPVEHAHGEIDHPYAPRPGKKFIVGAKR